MASHTDLKTRFMLVLKPTPGQAFTAFMSALVMLMYGYNVQIVTALGITSEAITTVLGSVKAVFDPVIRSGITENAVLIGFWSSVGLLAYLVSWGFYSAGVAARNEVTIATRYANHGQIQGPWATLRLKALCAVFLLLMLVSLVSGIKIWIEVGLPLFNGLSLGGVIGVIVAVIGLAMHLYLVFAAVQLTFLPWYQEQAFTNELG